MPRRRKGTKGKKKNQALKKVGHFFGGVYNKVERWGSGEAAWSRKHSKAKRRKHR